MAPVHVNMVDATPVIDRRFDIDKDNVDVFHTIKDTVSHTRGLGDSGHRVEVVEKECPECGFAHLIRQHRVYPEERSVVSYHCLNVGCPYYHDGEYDYANRHVPGRIEPAVTE